MIDDEDHEAKDALHSLFRAEEIREDQELLGRVSLQLDTKMDLFDRIRLSLPAVEDEDGEEVADSRRFEDFLLRISKSEKEEEAKTVELPAARRLRMKG